MWMAGVSCQGYTLLMRSAAEDVKGWICLLLLVQCHLSKRPVIMMCVCLGGESYITPQSTKAGCEVSTKTESLCGLRE